MKDFIFSYPTKVYFGQDALKKQLLSSWPRAAPMSCSLMAADPSRKTASMMK